MDQIPVFFPENKYITPEDTKRAFGDYLFLGSRWYFYSVVMALRTYYSALARKGRFKQREWAISSYKFMQLCEKVGGRFNITGLDNIRHNPDKPFVIACNHMSLLETLAFPAIIASMRPVTFVVKESIVKNRLLRDIMHATNPIMVARQNPREDLKKVLTEGCAHLAAGRSVIVFPQSTRTPLFDPEAFNSMGVKLAKAAGVKLMPAAIKTDFWENGKRIKDIGPLKRSRTIFMDFGVPLEITGNGSAEHQTTIEFIASRLKQWSQ